MRISDWSSDVCSSDLTEAGELNPTISPNGTYVSFVREGEVFVAPIGSGAERQITQGASDTVSWGTAEFVAQEEMGRRTGYWWSPGDRYIAVQRTDESPVGIVSRAAIGAAGPKVHVHPYPAAGQAHPPAQPY